jgi:hypothetical protein
MASGREGLLALRARVERAKARTKGAKQEVTERRLIRKVQEAAVPKPEVPSFSLALTNDGQPKKRPITCKDVRRWFREGLRRLYGDKFAMPPEDEWWTVHEMALAKKLLKQFDPALVEKAVAHFCSTWDQRVEAAEGRLGGIPGVGLLWKIRERVFAEVQGVASVPVKPKEGRKRKDKNSDEYRPPKKPMDVGWG